MLFLVACVYNEGIAATSFRVVEATSRLAVAQAIVDNPDIWSKFLRDAQLYDPIVRGGMPYYADPKPVSAKEALRLIDRSYGDGDSRAGLFIHPITEILTLPVSSPIPEKQGAGSRVWETGEQDSDPLLKLIGIGKEGPTNGGTRIVDEWLRQNRFPHIEFRTFNGEREACIKERLQVWQVIMVAKSYGMDTDKTAEHLSLRPEQVRSALNYYAAYPEEIDRALADNDRGFERLREMLPGIELAEVSLPVDV